jgi:hypothetical protein
MLHKRFQHLHLGLPETLHTRLHLQQVLRLLRRITVFRRVTPLPKVIQDRILMPAVPHTTIRRRQVLIKAIFRQLNHLLNPPGIPHLTLLSPDAARQHWSPFAGQTVHVKEIQVPEWQVFNCLLLGQHRRAHLRWPLSSAKARKNEFGDAKNHLVQ